MDERIYVNSESLSANRARMERVLRLAATMLNINPDYVSLTPGQVPQDYVPGSGSAYGFYLKGTAPYVVQPVVWNEGIETWEHFGPGTVTTEYLTAAINAAKAEIQAVYEDVVMSDPTLGGETPVSAIGAVKNIIAITQAEYDALSAGQKVLAGVLYLIEKDE